MIPDGGDFATLKIVRKLREQLSLTEDEIVDHKVKQVNGELSWEKANKRTEMNFSDLHTEMIREPLKKLNETKKLKEREHFSIYEQFIGGK